MSLKLPAFILFLLSSFMFVSCKSKGNPHVVIKTALGNITVELYPDKAPITVQNFLRYVNEKRLINTTFYRAVTSQPDNQPDKTVKIDVIQGGFALHLTDSIKNPQALPPIVLETTNKTGVLHQDGTISMARDTPDSAQAEFFICIGDQPELNYGGKRNPDGQGFAAFGKVVKGMDVVQLIQRQPSTNQMLEPTIPILDVVLE